MADHVCCMFDGAGPSSVVSEFFLTLDWDDCEDVLNLLTCFVPEIDRETLMSIDGIVEERMNGVTWCPEVAF